MLIGYNHIIITAISHSVSLLVQYWEKRKQRGFFLRKIGRKVQVLSGRAKYSVLTKFEVCVVERGGGEHLDCRKLSLDLAQRLQYRYTLLRKTKTI